MLKILYGLSLDVRRFEQASRDVSKRFCLKVAILMIFFQKTTNLMIDHGFVDLDDSKQMAISS